jgi:nitrogen-specific signal transduction histidine kinase
MDTTVQRPPSSRRNAAAHRWVSGLGLATTYSVVTNRHHGEVSLTSVEDRTVATVTLPRAPSEPPRRSDGR